MSKQEKHTETELINSSRNPESTKEDLSWLFLLTGVLLGISIGQGVTKSEYYLLPGFGVVGGATGGIIAGIIHVFSWSVSKILKVVLYVVLIVSVGYSLFALASYEQIFFSFLYLLLASGTPGALSFLTVYLVTKVVSKQLTKSPANWWLFGIFLAIGIIISIAIMGFLAVLFGVGFFSQ